MHLADGVLTEPAVVLALDAVGLGAVALALRRGFDRSARGLAWTGTLAAFVLAVQALNVPLVPGASAHAIGTALLVLCLGPARAVVALTAVLLVQALLLGDGGLTVLGLNVLDMAVLPALVTWGLARALGASRDRLAWAGFLGAWLGTTLGAAGLATALVLGAGAPARLTFAWLVGAQSLAGLAEGVLTALAVRELVRRAPRLVGLGAARRDAPEALDAQSAAPGAVTHRGLGWLAAVLVVTVLLVPLASTSPDALEIVLHHLRAR
ncbi:MAG: energy-coupling factor ABC transporter permease [Sorangiineae bacterium]|nr:energy-coupling factor ABC transporter permease [Polyangiaceae bacterium]MEB2323447.1 energy-coupling factor ABC transporter permease [Sorangiineae bacterium]